MSTKHCLLVGSLTLRSFPCDCSNESIVTPIVSTHVLVERELRFPGARCDTNRDDCVNAPCLNGGECHDGINDFICVCPKEWSGKACEEVHTYYFPMLISCGCKNFTKLSAMSLIILRNCEYLFLAIRPMLAEPLRKLSSLLIGHWFTWKSVLLLVFARIYWRWLWGKKTPNKKWNLRFCWNIMLASTTSPRSDPP